MQHAASTSLYQVRRAREEDIRWAAALGQRVYQGLDVIPEATMLGWFHGNPNGFFTFWHGEQRIGNFDILPLRPAVMQLFVSGNLLEKDIRPEDLIPAAESHAIRDLHWESIVVDPAFLGARRPMTRLFEQTFLTTLAHLCPIDQVGNIYAIAASDPGERLLRRTGLSKIAEAATRLDGHPLFRGNVASYREAQTQLPAPASYGNAAAS
ncbi:hypothetical protein Terro_0061 [Terriglobus roseus DSM 18391]|uniref:N-acetyltransferase domain-containing protein n=1 Tax=Terriglobus roseus (strain DSM 18391 / NRRL B-41598 / KBS 63) TaxID=926566 RepID=I3ZAZ5_TERRK|nr:hypothetical protein [Terriglobus roseus]AFL86413.1 hypothetical protein Terro_0061 [Terriglobus roseus DSM 18391]